MALTAGDVLDQARSRHATFHELRHPHKAVLQFLSSYAKQLHGKVAAIDEDSLRVLVSEAMPLDPFVEGVVLPANRKVIEVAAIGLDGSEMPLDLVPALHRSDVQTSLSAVWQIGGVLFLGGTEQDWALVDSLSIATVPIPAALTTLASVLALPDTAELACVEAVAAFMARRGGADEGQDKPDASGFTGVAQQAEADFLAEVASGLNGTTFRTRDTYQP